MAILSDTTLDIIEASRAEADGATWALARTAAGPQLVVFVRREEGGSGPDGSIRALLDGLEGEIATHRDGTLLVGPPSARNAEALRRHLRWLCPRPIGARTSAGMGDRLGLATPGHVRALRAVGGGIAPIFAQQSIREMTRTGRSPRQVLDEATWGAFEEGWRDGVGADADHLKSTADIDACLAAGFTLFTVDPGEHVHSRAGVATRGELTEAVGALPWATLEDSESSLRARYLARRFDLEGTAIVFDEETLWRAAAKYGHAIAHVCTMYRHLASAAPAGAFELEISVDETASPTTHAEHVYIVTELARLGVHWTSLAPRFVGRFEKGVDYIGEVQEFERDVAVHAAIARRLGPYKLSLHSGSDKFSVYPALVRQTGGLVHLKTAGTSYLEALRTVAMVAPPLLREIYAFACERYGADRASYHVSGEVERAPSAGAFTDTDLRLMLDQFDAREILHVTYGSVLTARAASGEPRFAHRLLSLLAAHRDTYTLCVSTHFVRHLRPFAHHAREPAV